MFELHLAFQVQPGAEVHFLPHAVVLPESAPGNEVMADGIVPVGELQSALRRDPPRQPVLDRPSHAPDRIADQVAIVGVAVAILVVPVIQIADIVGLPGRLGIGGLDMKIEFRQAWKRVT